MKKKKKKFSKKLKKKAGNIGTVWFFWYPHRLKSQELCTMSIPAGHPLRQAVQPLNSPWPVFFFWLLIPVEYGVELQFCNQPFLGL
jgi:hypothetical protein